MRRLPIFLAALVLALVLPGARPAVAAPDPVAAEREFVVRINQLRAGKGLGQLVVDDELTGVARRWAAKMAEVDQISHNPDLASQVHADWRKLGENVGVGMTVESLHDAFVASPAHYRNLVDGDFTHIGVGVVLGRDGALFTAHQFMQLRPAAAAARAAAPPAPTTSSTQAPKSATKPAPATSPAPAVSARLVLVLQQLRALDPR